MFLSLLIPNVGNDPNRPRPGRQWLRNPYRVHQRLSMAFPFPSAKDTDNQFLQTFDPAQFQDVSGQPSEWTATAGKLPRQSHIARDADHGFLFRIDSDHNGRPFVIVQSAREPDWHYAFHNAEYLLDAPPQVKPLPPEWEPRSSERYRFRLLANPTEKTKRLTKREQEAGQQPRAKSRRVAYHNEESQLAWLERKARDAGFSIESILATPAGIIRAYRSRDRDEKPMIFHGVHFDGMLQVVDPQLLMTAIKNGIGSAKGFGFGLLSLARG